MGWQGKPKQDAWYSLLSTEQKLKRGHSNDAVIDLVDALLYRAIEMKASDIHLQPDGDQLRVRYRLDGVLYDQDSIPAAQMLPVISRIKVLSLLDIAERRVPQDGKFKALVQHPQHDAHHIDFRVSSFPSTYGEKLVIRILDRSHNLLHLETVGLPQEMLHNINQLMAAPHGFFLVTGPTGSGKTTTLYAMLSRFNRDEKNIVTMEDPVEYDLQGITQSQVNIKTGFNFENGLRSMLRQDPDIIMIGEIRDKPTVQIAIESALTGHLVLSTLHTNDAAGAISRLLDMGVEPFLINATLTGVLAQRLARKLCQSCKYEVPLTADQQAFARQHNVPMKTAFQSKGCRSCMNLGHAGRIGIFELLMLNDDLRQLIIQKTPTEVIRKKALETGMKLLVADGLHKVAQGIISFDEFLALSGL